MLLLAVKHHLIVKQAAAQKGVWLACIELGQAEIGQTAASSPNAYPQIDRLV